MQSLRNAVKDGKRPGGKTPEGTRLPVWIRKNSISGLTIFFFFSDAKFKPAARNAKNGEQACRRRRHGQHSAG